LDDIQRRLGQGDEVICIVRKRDDGGAGIDLQRQHDDHYMLVVRDNGDGLPKDLDFRNTETLGLQLVNTLTDQIGGSIELGSSAGTEVKVTFTDFSHQERRHDNGHRTDTGR